MALADVHEGPADASRPNRVGRGLPAGHWLADVTGPRRRHTHNVPPDALSDGHNLIEVRARQPVKITWVEIAVK